MPTSLQNWWLFAGKFHPMVVHFPIALLLVAALLEFLRIRRGDRTPSKSAAACLVIGAVSAVISAALGWSDAITSGHSGSDAWVLSLHRWLGIAAAAVAILVVLLALLAKTRNTPRPFAWYRLGLLTSAALVAITGHFGGSLIYGTNYIPESFAKASGTTKDAPPGAAAEVSFKTPIGFARDVQPIFAKRCYQCHAGDKPESQLHLDTLAGALKGGKSGHAAIVAGNPGASELVKLIKGEDPERKMPPKGGALEPQQISVLEAWIAQGAKWSGSEGEHWHWAYRAPVRSNPPEVKDTFWARNPIDSFVLAKLESLGLKPSSEADKETLLRRVTLDLTGLPPIPAEVDAFLTDSSSGAYERVVERLLASPAYGERMAMKWLDLARYADTHGYEKDERRTMWPYRDWVIDAFNRDLPYNQFTIEQLAGDLLLEPTTEQLIATGFNRNTQINEEGGVDAEEFRVDAVIDRTNTMGTVWLGSTVGSAQCHNHKNDPITQEEYYRLFAYFNNDDSDVVPIATGSIAAGGMLPISKREDREEFARLKDQIADLQKKLAEFPETVLASAQVAWEKEQAKKQPVWTVLAASRVESVAGATLTKQEDGSYLASGKSEDKDTYTFEAPVELAAATGLKLELLPDPSLPGKGIGRSSHANIVLQDFRVEVAYPGASGLGEFTSVPIAQAGADHEQGVGRVGAEEWPIAGAIDADPKTGWALGPKMKEAHAAIFRFGRALGGGAGSSGSSAVIRVTMAQNYGGFHVIGRFRLSVTNDPEPLGSAPLSTEIAGILAKAERNEEEATKLAAYYRSISPALRPIRDSLEAARKRQNELTVAKAMVMKRAGSPRETHVFGRGSFLSPEKKVEPGLPVAMTGGKALANPPRDRLELARWLVDAGNPMTARVEVNRLWEMHFGRGLVETSEDFGVQGDMPSHPELLDWMSTEFVRQGWSVKAMHRLIVGSATYRQASNVNKDVLEKDPYDKLLTRGARLRVEAETVRDVALAASGLLVEKVGGPSVFPPQPGGIWTMIYNNDQWVVSAGEDKYRRGLYTFSRRTSPYPTFVNFDSTSREVACTRRARTNTPLQALTTLNDPQFVEAAVALGARMMREGGETDAQRAAYGVKLCTGRRASEAEVARLVELLWEERKAYAEDGAGAEKFVSVVSQKVREGLDSKELAAWGVVGNVVLNLDETITRP